MSAAVAVVEPPVVPSPLASERRAPGELAALLILATVFFTVAVDYVVMMPLGPQLQEVFRINIQQFNVAVGAYALAAGLAGLGAALVMDRFDRKRALLFLYAGFAVGTLGCALAPSYGWLVGMRALAGVFGGVVGGVVLAIVGDTVPESRRGAAVGIVTTAFPLAQVAGVPLSLWVAHAISWHVVFLWLAALSALILVAAAVWLPRVRGHLRAAAADAAAGGTPASRLWAVVVDRNHLRAFGLMAGITLGGFLLVPNLAVYMVRNVGVSQAHLPWLYAVGGACTLFTMPLAGRLADRLGKRRVFTVMMVATTGAVLLLSRVPAGAGVVAASAIMALYMVCTSGRYVPAMAMVTASVTPAQRGGFMSVNSAISQLFSALTAGLAGQLIHEAPDGRLVGFATAGGVAALLTVGTLFLGRTLRRAEDDGTAGSLAGAGEG